MARLLSPYRYWTELVLYYSASREVANNQLDQLASRVESKPKKKAGDPISKPTEVLLTGCYTIIRQDSVAIISIVHM